MLFYAPKNNAVIRVDKARQYPPPDLRDMTVADVPIRYAIGRSSTAKPIAAAMR